MQSDQTNLFQASVPAHQAVCLPVLLFDSALSVDAVFQQQGQTVSFDSARS